MPSVGRSLHPAAVYTKMRDFYPHEMPRAERDGKLDNRASLPPLRGASASKRERMSVEQAWLPKRSHALASGLCGATGCTSYGTRGEGGQSNVTLLRP
jgi:hypothetical protein